MPNWRGTKFSGAMRTDGKGLLSVVGGGETKKNQTYFKNGKKEKALSVGMLITLKRKLGWGERGRKRYRVNPWKNKKAARKRKGRISAKTRRGEISGVHKGVISSTPHSRLGAL